MLGTRAAVLYCSKIVRMGLNLLGMMVVARMLGPEIMGMNSYAGTFIAMFWFIADFALESAHVHHVSSGRNEAQCVGALILFKTLCSAAAAAVIVPAIWLLEANSAQSNEQVIVIYVWLAANLIENLTAHPPFTFFARKEVAKATIIDLVKSGVNLVLVLVFAFSWKSATAIALANAAGNVSGGLLGVFMYRGYPIAKPTKKLMEEYFQFVKPMLFVTVAIAVNQNIGRVLVGSFYSVTEVAYLHAANRITTIVLFASGAISTLLLPSFSERFQRGDVAEVQRLLHQSEKYLSLFTMPVVLVAFLLGESLVWLLLGDQFMDSVMIFQILVGVSYLDTLNRPLWTLFVSAGKTTVYSLMVFCTSTVLIVLSIVLIPEYLFGMEMAGIGGLGAAIARTAAAIIGVLLSKALLFSCTGIKPYWSFLKHVFSAAVTCLLFLFLQSEFGYGKITQVALHLTGGFAVYFLLLRLLGEFGMGDVAYLWKHINPWQVKRYIGDEMASSKRDNSS